MGRNPLLQVSALVVAMLSTPVEAAITDISLRGVGRVDYSQSGNFFGMDYVGPSVGTPVFITLRVHLGDADPNSPVPAPPDDFTGTFQIDEGSIEDGFQSFAWNVEGGKSQASTNDFWVIAGGKMKFVNGRLNQFTLIWDDDPDGNLLSNSTWGFGVRLTEIGWGGSWSIVPEPATWMMFVAGFGLAGAATRVQRRLAAAYLKT